MLTWRAGSHPSLVREVIKEYSDLRDRINTLEERLIMIVRTGWPG